MLRYIFRLVDEMRGLRPTPQNAVSAHYQSQVFIIADIHPESYRSLPLLVVGSMLYSLIETFPPTLKPSEILNQFVRTCACSLLHVTSTHFCYVMFRQSLIYFPGVNLSLSVL